MDEKTRQLILSFQENEITEHYIYKALAKRAKGKNKEVLLKIAEDELKHYKVWESLTKTEVKPNKKKIFFYLFLAFIFGITFAIKLMESGEQKAEEAYSQLKDTVPEAADIMKDEDEHEKMLINMIEEERLSYIGSMVLGLNDALVELTGSLAGFTLALQNSKVIGVAGFILGIAASLSMAASEYLSQKSEEGKNPLKAAIYTGLAYVVVVLILVLPYFIIPHYLLALILAIINVIIIIYLFTFFVSVVQEKPFKPLFIEMLSISMGVAVISFIIGIMARKFLGIEI